MILNVTSVLSLEVTIFLRMVVALRSTPASLQGRGMHLVIEETDYYFFFLVFRDFSDSP